MQGMEQEFVQRFAEVWKHPSPERLVVLLHPDMVLYQPQAPAIRGKQAARREFERLLRWLPDLCGDVKRWCGASGVVFIEWHMHFPIGRRLAIRAVDRFVLWQGLGIERAVYFNPLPLLAAVVTHPQAWPRFIRYRFGRG
jgi:hypothetical protein